MSLRPLGDFPIEMLGFLEEVDFDHRAGGVPDGTCEQEKAQKHRGGGLRAGVLVAAVGFEPTTCGL